MVIRKRLNRTQAIKAFCFECLGFQRIVNQCTAWDCPLFPYRTGKEQPELWPPIIEKFEKEGYFKKHDAQIEAAKKKKLQ